MTGTALAVLLSLAAVLSGRQTGREGSGNQPEVLRRDPATLPQAAADRWLEWRPSDPIPEQQQQALRAGMRAYFAGDYATAARELWAMLEREPDFPPALYQLGVTYFRLRRYGDCARVFERFLRAAPGEVGATQALAHSYYSLGDYPAALAHYQRVLEANPDSVEALRGYALAHLRTSQLEQALELLDRCLTLRPEHADALYWKAQVLFDLGRAEEARAEAERARELDAFDPRPWFLLSQVLHELGDDAQAEAAERRFLELDLIDQKVRTLEGQLLFEPQRVETHKRLVDLQRASGNDSGTQTAVARLIQAVPEDLAVRSFALEALHAIGAAEAAQQVADGIERDFAGTAEAWRVLRDYYDALGDRVRQIRAGERYLRLGGGR